MAGSCGRVAEGALGFGASIGRGFHLPAQGIELAGIRGPRHKHSDVIGRYTLNLDASA